MSSSADIEAAMMEAVKLDPKMKTKFNAVVSFSIDGGDPFVLNLKKDGQDSGSGKPDLQVITSLKTIQDLLAKKMTPQQAFMKGKLKIKGKMALAMKLKTVMDATRKHMATQASRL